MVKIKKKLFFACFLYVTQSLFAQQAIMIYDTLDSWLTIGTPIGLVYEKIGNPDFLGNRETWESSGNDYRYYQFNCYGLSMYTEITDESEKVYNIIIQRESPLRTSRGISLGATRQYVMQQYADCIKKEQYLEDTSMLFVNDIFDGTFFLFDDNEILMQIIIGPLAE